ncbi:MAG: DUF2617 family protein [Pseudomonadota bacterium]
MEYIAQQADQLRLNVIYGSVPRDQVQLLCSGILTTANGSINAHIIGASHFFEWKNNHGEVVFSEIFACQKINVKESLFYGAVNKSTLYSKNINGIDYAFSARQVNWDENLLSHFDNLCAISPTHKSFALRYQFPDTIDTSNKQDNQEKNQGAAITLLSVQQLPKIIQLDSLHAYPKEQQLVISQTKITLSKS